MRIHTHIPGFSVIPYTDWTKNHWWVLRVEKGVSIGGRMVDDMRQIGFSEVRDGLWSRPHHGLTSSMLRQIFPSLIVDKSAAHEKITPSEEARLNAGIPIGINIMGDQVIEQNGQRFISAQNGVVFEPEWSALDRGDLSDWSATEKSALSPGLFLRAASQKDLMDAIAPLVFRMVNGEFIDNRDVDTYVEKIKMPGANGTVFSRRDVQESLEALQVRYMANRISRSQFRMRSDSVALYEHQPIFSARNSTQIALQQFSTPGPLAIAAQLSVQPFLLAKREGGAPLRIYEPSVGHGALLSAILGIQSRSSPLGANGANMPSGPFELFATELDANRFQRFERTAEALGVAVHVQNKDATIMDPPKDLDLVIANPPFGTMEFSPESARTAAQVQGITKIDHWIAYKAIQGLKPGGKAVLLLGGDSAVDAKSGVIGTASWKFLQKIAKEYRIDGLVEVDGGLYARNGAGWPIRMLVLTRGDAGVDLSEQLRNIPKHLPVLKDWNGVFLAAKEMQGSAWIKVLADTALRERQAENAEETNPEEVSEVNPNDLVTEDLDAALSEAATIHAVTGNELAMVPDEDDLEENAWQSPYVPASRMGSATAMIPSHLEEPIRKAMSDVILRIEEEEGLDGVDEFVADRLGWDMETLNDRLSPEQIDSLALAFNAQKDHRAIIQGDQTGMGKGRVIAAMAEAARLRGSPVIFITEKPHLFTDLYRDLMDIGAVPPYQDGDLQDMTTDKEDGLFLSANTGMAMTPHAGQGDDHAGPPPFIPLIVNAVKSVIYDQDGHVMAKHDKKMLQKALVTDSFAGANLIFMTYSQLASGNADKRRDWLLSAIETGIHETGRAPLVILDEAHNAAGASATGVRVSAILGRDVGCDVLYASATFAKKAENLLVYHRAMPEFVDAEMVNAVVDKAGDLAMETISRNLAQDGTFVRREHDLSALTFTKVEPVPERLPFVRSTVDSSARVLELMGFVTGEVDKVVNAKNVYLKEVLSKLSKEERKQLPTRLGAFTQNFGSRLYQMSRQLYMVLKTDVVADACIDALMAGKKPVIVVEQTMESAIRGTIADMLQKDVDEEGEVELSQSEVAGVELENDFRVALHRMADRLTTFKETDRRGNVKETILDSRAVQDAMARIHEAIDDLPLLPLSPIDVIQDRLAAKGFTLGEISGRGLRFEGNHVVAKEKANVSQIARAFNAGDLDVALITRSGNSGISLHASEKVQDQRQRVLIEWQIPADVSVRIQAMGRVNRKGQVNSPVICSVSTGLPGENRDISMQQVKLRRLSASTTGDRDNPALNRDIPDIVNTVGNTATYDFARENPQILRKMGLSQEAEIVVTVKDPHDLPERLKGVGLVSKITGRGHMLSVSQQESLWNMLKAHYLQVMDDLDAAGENPLKSEGFQWENPSVLRSGTFMPQVDESAFGNPVFADEIQFIVTKDPMRSDRVRSMVQAVDPDKIRMAAERIRARIMPEMLNLAGGVKLNEDETLAQKIEELLHPDAESPLSVSMKSRRHELNRMAEFVETLTAGKGFSLIDPMDATTRHAVLTRVRIPEEAPHQWGQWQIQMVFAGDSSPTVMSLRSLMHTWSAGVLDDYDAAPSGGSQSAHDERLKQRYDRYFDEAPEGSFKEKRVVLQGNLFSALATVDKGQHGYYIDQSGIKNPVILLPKGTKFEAMMSGDFQLGHAGIMTEVLIRKMEENRGGFRLYTISSQGKTFQKDLRKACAIAYDRHSETFALAVPGARGLFGKVYLDKALLKLMGKPEFEGTAARMGATFQPEQLGAVIQRLSDLGVRFYLPGQDREMVDQIAKARRTKAEPEKSADMALSA